ncbi:MAG: hypothetical protein LKI53_04650 [Bacteroidales bacterium]|jgi:hypothetical protein|nr:hypothetical protein [Bacteroidales bacterium]
MESAFQVSFVPPLSTNGFNCGQYTNNFSLNLLAGTSKNEKAFTLGGIANIINNDANGFQTAGLFNYIGNNGKGFALSGLANISKNDYSGFQLAGLVNVAGNVKGVQMAGLLNIADKSDYPIGLVNIIKQGEFSVAATYDGTGSSLITFRSGSKVTYGIVGVGFNHKTRGDEFVLSGGLGAHINICDMFRINNELTGETIGVTDGDNTFKISYALLPAFRPVKHFEIFAGPAITYMQSEDILNKDIFPSNSLWKSYGSSRLKQLFIGYRLGIQYIF